MRKIATCTLFILCLFIVKAKAQDIHYSQFYASPLTLNPALTGEIDGQYRIGVMYRNQWASISTPYVTPSISFDWNGLFPKLIKTGTLSGGILILNDQAGEGNLNDLTVNLSAAYRIFVGKGDRSNISIGLQGGYNQESINFNNLTFQSEFDGSGFNPNQNTPVFGKSSFGYFNINGGVLYTSKISKNLDFYGGVAMFDINQPKETFYNEGTNTLDAREVVHAGFRIGLTDKIALLPAALYMTQAGTYEFNIGTNLSYLIKTNNSDATLYVGGYYRVDDAVIAMVGIEYKSVRLGISYDINTSSLQTATNDKGAFELSLNYIGLFTLINEEPILFCPRY